jgi:hypothetical protein
MKNKKDTMPMLPGFNLRLRRRKTRSAIPRKVGMWDEMTPLWVASSGGRKTTDGKRCLGGQKTLDIFQGIYYF